MKTFTYTIRDKDGRLKKGTVQAADRAGAMREVKALGGVPLSVSEARPGAGGGSPQGVRRVLLWALAAVPVVLAALWFWWPWAKDAQPVSATPSVSSVPLVSSVTQGGVQVQATSGEDTQGTEETQEPGPAETAHAQGDVVAEAATGEPPPAREAAARPPRAFTTATEQVLGWIANTVPGGPPPILPVLPPNERTNIIAILERDIVLYDDDSEAVSESKHNVAYAKQMLRQYLADGGTPEDFLGHYHAGLVEAHREWREAQGGVTELLRAGDAEGAVRFYMERDAALRGKGIRPIHLPPALRPLLEEMGKGEAR